VKRKRKVYIPRDKLLWYFNLKPRTFHGYTKLIDFHDLYTKFIESKTLREQKDILYGLHPKVKEELLDHIWERYIEKIERKMLYKELTHRRKP
jgi:hypothetical protein